MATIEESVNKSWQVTSTDIEPTPGRPDGAEDYGVKTEKATGLKGLPGRSLGTRLGLIFLTGLLLGWIVIGWWLWPVKWTNSKPWLLQPDHQRAFVGLVAENYWHTRDISRAREALDGWDYETLTQLLATMESQASSTEERRYLAALAKALALPDPEISPFSSFAEHRALIISGILAAAPLVAAGILAIAPRIRGSKKKSEPALGEGMEELEAELEKLLSQEGEEGQPAEGEEEEGEAEEGGEGEEGAEKKQGDEEEEEDDEAPDEDDEWLDDGVGEDGELVGDILSTIFEEESETLAQYEALCKGLEDIEVDDLVSKSQEVLDQLVRSNSLRQTQIRGQRFIAR
jgi:hypothetical protein